MAQHYGPRWGPQPPLQSNWPQSRLPLFVPPRRKRPTNMDEAGEMWSGIPQWADEKDPGQPGEYKSPPRASQNRERWTNPLVGEMVSEGHGFVGLRVGPRDPVQLQVWIVGGVVVKVLPPEGVSDEQVYALEGIPASAEIVRPAPTAYTPQHRAWMLGGTAFYRDTWSRRGCPSDPVQRDAWYAGFLEEAAGIDMRVYTVAEAIGRIEAHGVTEDARERPISEAVDWVMAGIKPAAEPKKKRGGPRKKGRPSVAAAKKREQRARAGSPSK
jgi:hypothetical protein